MRQYLVLGFAVAFVLLMAGCGGRKEPTTASDPAQPSSAKEIVVPVEAQLPVRGPISEYFDSTTRVEAENRVDVTSQAIGKCMKVFVEEGDEVRKGQILAELDTASAAASLQQAEVQVHQRKAEYERVAQSRKEDGNLLYSDADYDMVRFAYEQAVANRDMQQVQFDNLTIRAPISGIVTKRLIQQGTLVSTGTPTFTLVAPGSFILTINPPEKELARLSVGQEAQVQFDSLPDEVFTAKVRRINPSVDAASGTVKVTLDIDDATRKRLRESAFARVRLVMATHENALLIVKDAVVEENGRTFLFVVREKASDTAAVAAETAADDAPLSDEPVLIAERIEIETGLEDSVNVEVLSGLDETMPVVILGQHTLKSGSLVKLTDASAEILSKAHLSAQEALDAAKERRDAGAKTESRIHVGF